MKTKLIKLQDKFILVSDEEIKAGDKVLETYADSSVRITEATPMSITINSEYAKGFQKKIISENPDFSLLSEEDCKTIGWVDVEKLAEKEMINTKASAWIYNQLSESPSEDNEFCAEVATDFWIEGFKTAQSLNDKMFSLEDVVSILDDIQKDLADYQNEIGIGMMDDIQWQQMFVDRVIASITSYEQLSLQQTSWDVEIEMEEGEDYLAGMAGSNEIWASYDDKPKITNNSIKVLRIL